jgi:hypothetical protein
MARTRWPLKCSEFDGAEKRDNLPTAGLTPVTLEVEPPT